jgi:hypothetical protein
MSLLMLAFEEVTISKCVSKWNQPLQVLPFSSASKSFEMN